MAPCFSFLLLCILSAAAVDLRATRDSVFLAHAVGATVKLGVLEEGRIVRGRLVCALIPFGAS
jgi:hypothetical protein